MWPMLTLRGGGCGGEGREERKESSEEASLRSVVRHEEVMGVDEGRWLIVLMTDSHLFFALSISMASFYREVVLNFRNRVESTRINNPVGIASKPVYCMCLGQCV